MVHTEIKLLTRGFPDRPAFDTAISHAVLQRVARGELPATVRLHQPGRIVAFGRHDTLVTGYPQAVRAARAEGFGAVERLAGGRAAVFHDGTLAFSWATPQDEPRLGIRERFMTIASLTQAALATLGVTANIGGVPGEYCPGEYSLNVGGIFKVMGVGQRLVAGAAHIGGVIVVAGGADIRRVLVPVYEHLGIEWDPHTAGDLARIKPGIAVEDVRKALVDQFRTIDNVVPTGLDPETLEQAAALVDRHEPSAGMDELEDK